MEPERRNFKVDQELGRAIDYLATGHERIRERLAYIAGSTLGGLSPEDFPEPLRELASSIFDRLDTTEPTGNEGSYAASIHAMSEDEASQLASDIVSLHYRVGQYWSERGQ
jgi:hypothetical protein